MHVELVRHVEMTRPDSLSDAVSKRVRLGKIHSKRQLTKAPGVLGGQRRHRNHYCVGSQSSSKCCLRPFVPRGSVPVMCAGSLDWFVFIFLQKFCRSMAVITISFLNAS